MDGAQVRRWYAGHRAAEARALALAEREGPLAPDVAFEQAMELCDLIDLPVQPDAVREREVAEVRALWTALKRRWAASRDHG